MSFVLGFEKTANNAGSLPGAIAAFTGFSGGSASGKSSAKTTAGHLSRRGYKTRNEDTAHNIAQVTAPVGALLGLGLALKHRPKLTDKLLKHVSGHGDMLPIYHYGIPVVGGTAGGIAAGAATGALTSLRGAFSKHKKEKK